MSDGLRISVMSRHTLDDGVTPDLRIQPCDLHISMFGPAPKLIGKYKRKEIDWVNFEKEYRIQMNRNRKAISKLRIIIKLALDFPITFLCVEETPEYCHRRLLAEICQRMNKNLVIRYY